MMAFSGSGGRHERSLYCERARSNTQNISCWRYDSGCRPCCLGHNRHFLLLLKRERYYKERHHTMLRARDRALFYCEKLKKAPFPIDSVVRLVTLIIFLLC